MKFQDHPFPPDSAYLRSDAFADWENPEIQEFAKSAVQDTSSPVSVAVQLYYAIRDRYWYYPFDIHTQPEKFRASDFLNRKQGHCIDKANLLVACARFFGIPARYRFANVRNHIGTERLEAMLKTDVLVFHGMAELWLEGKWVKATPAFNKELCEKLNVVPLEFNGHEDSIFQEYDREGGDFMEYLVDHGDFAEFPFNQFLKAIREAYPHMEEVVKTGKFPVQ